LKRKPRFLLASIEFDDKPLGDKQTLDDNGIQHGDTIYAKKPATPPSTPVNRTKTPATPKKKSYLPENWKENRDRFGEVITTYYAIDHNVDEGESFIRGKTKEDREKFNMNSPRRKSLQNQT
jgi:hypothetical protein